MLLVLAFLPEIRGGYSEFVDGSNTAVLFGYIDQHLLPLKSAGGGMRFLNILLLFAESLFLNKIVSDHRLVERPGFVPAMTFLLLHAILPFRINTFFVLINGLLIGLVKLLIVIYKQEKPSNNLVAAGFITGFLAAMHTGYWTTYLWLITALFIMRPVSSKEWLICTLGFLMPFYFTLSWQYLTDQLDLAKFFSQIEFTFKMPVYSPLVWSKIIVLAILPFLGLWLYSPNIGKMVIQNRKTYLFLLMLELVVFCILLLKFGILGQEIMFLLAPASFLLAPLFLTFKKEFIPNLLFIALIALALLR